MKSQEQLDKELKQFVGTRAYHRFSSLTKILITDGVKFLVEQERMFWFLDIIVSYQNTLIKESFQRWSLIVKNGKGKVKAINEKGKLLIEQNIPFVDTYVKEIVVYLKDNIIFLLSEY